MWMKRDIQHFKEIKITSGAYYSVMRGWLKLHLSEQFLSEPISTHLSWVDEQERWFWEKHMNKKKINYIIATSVAEEIDLDAAIASIVVKERHLKRRRLQLLKVWWRILIAMTPAPRRHLCKNVFSIKI